MANNRNVVIMAKLGENGEKSWKVIKKWKYCENVKNGKYWD